MKRAWTNISSSWLLRELKWCQKHRSAHHRHWQLIRNEFYVSKAFNFFNKWKFFMIWRENCTMSKVSWLVWHYSMDLISFCIHCNGWKFKIGQYPWNKISCTFRESLQSFQDQIYELHNFNEKKTIFEANIKSLIE